MPVLGGNAGKDIANIAKMHPSAVGDTGKSSQAPPAPGLIAAPAYRLSPRLRTTSGSAPDSVWWRNSVVITARDGSVQPRQQAAPASGISHDLNPRRAVPPGSEHACQQQQQRRRQRIRCEGQWQRGIAAPRPRLRGLPAVA